RPVQDDGAVIGFAALHLRTAVSGRPLPPASLARSGLAQAVCKKSSRVRSTSGRRRVMTRRNRPLLLLHKLPVPKMSTRPIGERQFVSPAPTWNARCRLSAVQNHNARLNWRAERARDRHRDSLAGLDDGAVDTP